MRKVGKSTAGAASTASMAERTWSSVVEGGVEITKSQNQRITEWGRLEGSMDSLTALLRQGHLRAHGAGLCPDGS